MAFITAKELETHLYKEDIDTISREDETILTAAVDAAIEEAYGYLGAYDRKKIFEATEGKRNPLLLIFVKDIAVWHFINLCNAGCDLELREKRYDRAVSWLRQVQRGETTANLPIVDENGDGEPDTAGEYIYGSNPKRNQHF